MTPQVEKRLQELAREHDGTLTSSFALMEEVADSFRRERDELWKFLMTCKDCGKDLGNCHGSAGDIAKS